MENKGSDEGEKLKAKFMSMWHNMKYSWALKSKTAFSKSSPVFVLGKCYYFKANDDDSPPEDLQRFSVVGDIEAFRQDFASRVWLTYREDFPPLPGSTLTSDCGWGCMLRAGQMMLAQALVLHYLGRDWCWPEALTLQPLDVESRTNAAAKRFVTSMQASLQSTSRLSESRASLASEIQMVGFAEEAAAHLKKEYHRNLVSWFADVASAPLGLHSLIHLGLAMGKQAGDWYGPAVVAHILKEAVKEATEPGLAGITVYVSQDCTVYSLDVIDCHKAPKAAAEASSGAAAAEASSGAAAAEASSGAAAAEASSGAAAAEASSGAAAAEASSGAAAAEASSGAAAAEASSGAAAAEASSGAAAAEASSGAAAAEASSGAAAAEASSGAAAAEASSGAAAAEASSGAAAAEASPVVQYTELSATIILPEDRAVIILIPVRLGGERTNPEYFDFAKKLLSLEYCIGIIGGKPKHACYFVGFQDDSLIYMDPHYCQSFVNVHASDFPLQSYHCPSPKKMPFSKMDPSCTFGFYSKSAKDYERIKEELSKLLELSPTVKYPAFTFVQGRSTDYELPVDLSTEKREWRVPGDARRTFTTSGDFVLL